MYFSVRRRDLGDAVVRMAVFGTVNEATCDVLAAAIHDAVTTVGAVELVIDVGAATTLDDHGVAVLLAGEDLASRAGVGYRIVTPLLPKTCVEAGAVVPAVPRPCVP